MTMGPYAQHAEPLIKRGYGAVPIIAGTKAPGLLLCGHMGAAARLTEALSRALT